MSKIAVGWDHAGVEAADAILPALERTGHEVVFSDGSIGGPVDYPDIAHAVASWVKSGEAQYGVLICGTGIGMAMTANKTSGVRAFVGHSPACAEMARKHNHANVVCFGARLQSLDQMYSALKVFLETGEDHDERHLRRVGEMEK